MGRGRRAHNRNSRKHTDYLTSATPMDRRPDLRRELEAALPDAPDGVIGEIARAATLSKQEATRILTTTARRHDDMDDASVTKARKLIDQYATVSA